MEEQRYKIVRPNGEFWAASGWRTDGKPCVYTEEQLPSTLDDGYFKLHKGETV